MDKRTTPKERRKHKRFGTYDGLYVFCDFYSGEIGKIIDISEGGLAFQQTGYKNWSDELNKIDIITGDYVFSIKDIPVKAVLELNAINEDSNLPLPGKRFGVQFSNPQESQTSQLKDFIENQVLKFEYLKH